MSKKFQLIISALCILITLLSALTILFTKAKTEKPKQYTTLSDNSLLTFLIPSGEIRINSGETLKLVAGGRLNLKVSAQIGNQNIKLTSDNATYGDYTIYAAQFTIPHDWNSRSTRNITILARGKNRTELYQAGGLTIGNPSPAQTGEKISVPSVSAPAASDSDNPTLPSDNKTSQGTVNTNTGGNYSSAPIIVDSPSSGNALDSSAKSKTCIITSDYAETRPVTPLSNTYVPTYVSLPYGTIDTIQDIASYNDGDGTVQYYVLASGRRVEVEDVKVLDSFGMKENSIHMDSCTTSNGASTMLFTTGWRVPYDVTFTPQSYQTGYEGKKYNVSSFTAERMEITFHYTASATGSFDISQSDVISSMSWYTDTANRKSTLVLYFKQPGRFYGYSMGYAENGQLYIKISNKPSSLSGSVIMIDPGHGGSDVGAVGCIGNLHEADLNLQMAQFLANDLIAKGATVYLTRTDNSDLSLTQRRLQAELIYPDLFISIHCNASANPQTHGTSVYYYSPYSQSLSAQINNAMASLFSHNVGSNFYAFSVCRPSVCPCVLVETAFLSNQTDCAVLSDENNRRTIASAIAVGVENYFISQA